MECIYKHMRDEWNETAGFFQKIAKCDKSRKVCQGGEDICSLFEGAEAPAEKKEEKKVEDEEHKEEEAGKEAGKGAEEVG